MQVVLRSRFIRGSVMLLALGLFATGCGKATTPVQGTAKVKGGSDPAALAGYGVMFEAVDPGPDGQMMSSSGEIDATGKFQLSTNGTNDGAYPGKYRVAITPPIPFTDGPPPKPAIHPKYQNLATSGLEATVGSSGNDFHWELDPPVP